MKIFIDAGHSLKDTGAIKNGYTENKMNMALCRKVLEILGNTDNDFKIISISDDRDLKSSIRLINEQCSKDDYAIQIHFNANNNENIRGVESYYSPVDGENQKRLAEGFSFWISLATGIPNKGAIKDSFSYAGALGWLRLLYCHAVLVEVCYLSNSEDMKNYSIEKAAQGISNAIKDCIINRERKIWYIRSQIDRLKAILVDIINKVKIS